MFTYAFNIFIKWLYIYPTLNVSYDLKLTSWNYEIRNVGTNKSKMKVEQILF